MAGILETVTSRGEVDVAALAQHFSVTASTVRRDLAHLEDQGLLSRTHGGAQRSRLDIDELPVRYRDGQDEPAKLAIAEAVASRLPPGRLVVGLTGGSTTAAAVRPLPVDATFDHQIGGDHAPAKGVSVVSRDWFAGSPLKTPGSSSVCYVNAFQTQADEAGVQRPDERSAWPKDLVLSRLGDDPSWGGEYLVDISTPAKRTKAAAWVAQMTDACAAKGFDAVEFDNLDSWTRFDDTPLEGRVPFGKTQAVAFAKLITQHAHAEGLAVGQKNTPQPGRTASLRTVGFDFAVAEECGQHDECGDYTAVFGGRVVVIEPGSSAYTFATC